MNNDNLNEIKSQIKTLSEAELHGIISGALLEIKTRAYNEGYSDGLAWGYEDKAVETPIVQKTPQQIRDEIIEQAKRDLAELQKDNGYGEDIEVIEIRGDRTSYNCNVDFVVNKEKRTVVVLLRGVVSNDLHARGIAKCDPTDCFNVHIGKAIALRRALGLEVPSEYLSAPQPSEVRVGDVVKHYGSTTGWSTKIITDNFTKAFTTEGYAVITSPVSKECVIIDDSHEGGEE
jgi:hypothetical protein